MIDRDRRFDRVSIERHPLRVSAAEMPQRAPISPSESDLLSAEAETLLVEWRLLLDRS